MSSRRHFDICARPCAARGSSYLVLASCLFFASFCGSVQAQAVYKSTGPGGKIIYTDKPVRQPDGRLTPVDAVEYANSGAKFDSRTRWSDPSFSARRSGDPTADAALDSSRRAAAAAAEDAARAAAQAYQSRVEASKNRTATAPATPAPNPASMTAPPLSAPVSGKPETLPSPAAAKPAIEPRVEKAVVEMIAVQHLVEQSIEVCKANQPADSNRLSAVMAKWRERNNGLLVRNQKLLYTAFTVAQIREMEETATISNRSKLERGNASVEEVRLKWCAQMVADIGKGVYDPVAKPEIAAALTSAR